MLAINNLYVSFGNMTSAGFGGDINRALTMRSAEATPIASAYARPRLIKIRKSISRCRMIACPTIATRIRLK